MPFDVFISYSHQDKAAADAACSALESAGVRCWIAPRDVAPGADWAGAIVSAIEDPATPLRVPVGQDAEMILGLRKSLDDQAFEDAMRKAVGLTW